MADLAIWRDKLVNSIARWRDEDAGRASEVGEQREEIKELIETTGVHKKALSWVRALDKMEQDKRDDVLRSFDALRNDVMEPHWEGQSTPDMFDGVPVQPAGSLPKPSYDSDFDPEDDDGAYDPDEVDEEAA
jgi:hypothetical protein